MNIRIMDEMQVLKKCLSEKSDYSKEYLAFYSSWFGGIVKNPQMMLIPLDDHMAHRGDGVFEVMKAVSRNVYLLEEHLDRLFLSAQKIFLDLPNTRDEFKTIILETLRAANQNDAIIRVYVSRGPGDFSVNPYVTVGTQVYVVITHLHTPPEDQYEKGLIIGKSKVPAKISGFAQIKSCNYLPNVLMKKEAIDRHLDYVIACDKDGNLTESATENILLVDKEGILVHPPLDGILKGTTMTRSCELAEENGIRSQSRLLSIEDILSAREVLITGTSLNVLPVVQFEEHKIADGKPGPIAKLLRELMIKDIESGPRLTAF